MHWLVSYGLLCTTTTALRSVDAFVAPPAPRTDNLGQHERAFTIGHRRATDDDNFAAIVEGLDELYPPQGLNDRIALSRKDGYWPYVATGEDPPQELVYGEFEIPLLRRSLERSLEIILGGNDEKNESDIIFCDLGSGTGRLVMATAALYPKFKLCRGIELLESIYEEAQKKLESCRVGAEPKFALPSQSSPPLAPIELECGSFSDPYSSFCDADIVFCFSTCLPDHARIDLSRSIGRQCKPGTVVVTTDYRLSSGGTLESLPDDPDYPTGEYAIEVVDSFEGDCAVVGGTSTVYVQRVSKSVGTGVRRVEPELPLGEIAFRAINRAEDEKAERSATFLRQVSNQMAFLGFPDSWRQGLQLDTETRV